MNHSPNLATNAYQHFSSGQCDMESGLPLRIPFTEWLDNQLLNQPEEQLGACFMLDPGLAGLSQYVDDDALDWVQRDLTQQLKQLHVANIVVGRFAYSRFALWLGKLESLDLLEQITEQILFACSIPTRSGGVNIQLHPKIGVALFNQHGTEAPQLLEAARSALSAALSHDYQRWVLYSSELGRHVYEEMRLNVQLQAALETLAKSRRDTANMVMFNEVAPVTSQHALPFELAFQPEIDLLQGKVIYLDTSLIWRHADYQSLSSSEILTLSGQLGYARVLGDWWLEQATAFWHLLRNQHFSIDGITLPLIFEQIAQPHFHRNLCEQCERLMIQPQQIQFSLTENVLRQDPEKVLPILQMMQQSGFRLIINHFGSGSASLAELQAYPIDGVCIEPDFVKHIHRDSNSHAIVRSILSITRWMSKDAIADGVQMEAQVAMLQRNGCHLMRGPWFMPPQDQNTFLQLIQQESFLSKLLPPGHQNQPTLLLLDDEPNILAALKRALRRDGYVIFATTDPEEAFQILAANRIDVVVSDQRMPLMSGTEFLKKVKDLHPKTMRMVLSGYTEVQSITEAINQGAIYKFLTKPWDDEQLRANIAEAFRRLNIETENERLQAALETANQSLIHLNHTLEKRVEEKTEQAARDLEFLRITQEMLDTLPMGIIGIDNNDMIATANETAYCWLSRGEGLVGELILNVLPINLVHEIMKFRVGEKTEWSGWQIIQHAPCKVTLRRMGKHSQAEGMLLLLQRILTPSD
ncbi:EAL domain-containing protein [Parvibium lacunae]|uniref:EAL domain-containing protein n=1 Tax=Parvibium lacunae TaxID=1888893 RepID=A0A368L6D1_9BURK|nr:EAL domain-containing protein [Parvibium lacunae]RCS59213.1 EAL domain-containing protein [Parvibium lacunae]